MQSMSFEPVVGDIGAQVIDNGLQGLQAGISASTSVTALAPAGGDDVSMRAATAFAAEAAQLLALHRAAQEELIRTGAAVTEIARRYAETDAAAAAAVISAGSLSGYQMAGV
jgi:hypothetical protein